MTECFPSILEVAQVHRVPCQRMQPHDLTLVPFRECDHDAPELGRV